MAPESHLISYALLILGKLFSYLCNGVTNGGDAGGFLIGNLDTEHALEFHKKLYGVQRICTEVIGTTPSLSTMISLTCFTISSFVILFRF